MSLTESGRACDFQGSEIMSRNVMATRRSCFSYRKMKDAISFQFDKPVYGMVYPGADPNIAYFGWAMNNMNRQPTWFFPQPAAIQGVHYLDFKENMNLRNAANYADVAILFSAQSRDWGVLNYYPEILGTAEILTDKHIQYQFILDESLTKEKLAPFRVLILANASCMSDKQIKVIRDFVFDGGTAYLSGHAGTCDELGIFRGQWPFADILGMQPVIPLRQYKAVSISQNGRQVKPSEELNCQIVKIIDRKKAQTIGETTTGSNISPAIFVTDWGKGKFFYSSSQFGVPLVEHERKMNEPVKWEYHQDQALYEFYTDLLKQVTNGNDFWEPVKIPEKVMVNIDCQNVSGVRSVMVNLLNATGVNHKFGDLVGNKSPNPAWPPLKEDIIFNLKINDIKNAYVVSPDFEGRKAVKFKEIKSGWQQITLPADFCQRYSIVFINY